MYEITKLCGNLERSSQSRETREKYWIIPLHGSLSSSNQQKVFSNAPSNTRKVGAHSCSRLLSPQPAPLIASLLESVFFLFLFFFSHFFVVIALPCDCDVICV